MACYSRASAWLLRLSVRGTGNKEIFRYQPSVNRYSLPVEKVSFIVFQLCRRSADVGKTIDRVLTTHPLQTVIKLSFVANGSESFRVRCFACWISPEVILFSGSFHLLQDPGYRVWSLASHTKRSVSAGTWYRRQFFFFFYRYWRNIYW